MIASIAWLLEFALETSGAFLAYRRRLTILTAYLAFSAAADVITFLILWRFGGNAYGVAEWITEAVQYLILCALACQIVARMLEDYRRLTGLACGLCALLGVVVGFVWRDAPTWEKKFQHSEISASFFVAAMIVVAWVTAAFMPNRKELEEPWQSITLGLILLMAGVGLCAAMNRHDLYPIPQIASLLLWNLAALRNQRKHDERTIRLFGAARLDANVLPQDGLCADCEMDRQAAHIRRLAGSGHPSAATAEQAGEKPEGRKPAQSVSAYDEEFLRKMKIQA